MKKHLAFSALLILLFSATNIVGQSSQNLPFVNSQAYSTLAAADTYAAAHGQSLYVTKNYIATAGTMTFTSNVVIEGGSLTCSGGKYAFTKTFNAPMKQVFPGCVAGDVLFADGSIDFAYPEWWGFSATENSPYINAALRAVNGKAAVVLGGRSYNTVQSVILTNNDTLVGVDQKLSYIRQSGAGGSSVYAIDTNLADKDVLNYLYRINIRNLSVVGGFGAYKYTPDRVVNLSNAALSNMENVEIFNGKYGLYITFGLYNNFKKVKVYGSNLAGLYITYGLLPTTTQVFDHCYFSGAATSLMTNGVVLAASAIGTSGGNILGTIFNDCIIETTVSSAMVVGRGADISVKNLYTENIATNVSSTDPVIDLWTQGTYSAFDYNNRAVFYGQGTIYGSNGVDPQSVAIKTDYVAKLSISGYSIGRVLDMFSFIDTSHVTVGSINLANNYLVYNRNFLVDAATYTALVFAAHKIYGEIPVAYNSLTRDRYYKIDRLLASSISTTNGAGIFTLNASSTTTTVANSSTTANSRVLLFPTTLSASTATGVYHSGNTAGILFTITSSSTPSADKTFNYLIIN